VLDYLIRGATVVDGTGGPSYTGDVGVRGGRIVTVRASGDGGAGEDATSTVDGDGLVVAPGFVDPHTHYDAQLFWDPLATPSNLHGVTTVVGGNCGFTLAPLHGVDADYTRRMMARVEGMPLVALESGVEWSWESFSDYLNAVENRGIGVNAGFLVGHCALRRYAMGPDAIGGKADAATIEKMTRLLHESLEAGGLGFSTTLSGTHSDGDGNPVASRHASREELLALCAATGEHEGTFLEGIVEGCLDTFRDDEIELLAEMSAAAGRSINWNVLTVDASVPGRVPRQMQASTRARELGGRVIALTMPVLVPMNMSFRTYCALFMLPGWGEVMGLPVPERMKKLADPQVRATMLARANSPEAGVFRRLADFGRYVIGDTYSAANEGLKGRVVKDVAAERGAQPFDTLVEIVSNDELKTVLWPMPTDNDPATWKLRQQVWNERDVLLGGSDAGAHLDRMCGAPYTTRFVGDAVRGRQLVSLERAVHLITGMPAAVFGLRERGLVREGYHADLVVFDPATVGSEDATLVADLPGDSPRLVAGATGVVRVLVNGTETIRDGVATGATPGSLLRSGRDTATVPTA
jgi:N-acyl-D-aspartate/D-glutamate deacylase